MGNRLIRRFWLVVLSACAIAARADDAGDRLREEAVRWCASAPESGDLDECADARVAKFRSPAHKAMVADANSAAERMLARCKQDDAAFRRCAPSANSAKTREARDLAMTVAELGMIKRSLERFEREKTMTRERCQRAGRAPGSVWLGMTSMEVRVCGWGEPESIHRTAMRGLVTEQWVYPSHAYLYLDNGRLTAVQD